MLNHLWFPETLLNVKQLLFFMNNVCCGLGCSTISAHTVAPSSHMTARGQILISHKVTAYTSVMLMPSLSEYIHCCHTFMFYKHPKERGCMHLWPSPTKQTAQERIPLQPTGFNKRQSAALCGPAAQSPGSLELNVPVILPGGSSGSWIQAITIKSGHS